MISSVTSHLNKNSEAFDMMHQSSMEMHCQRDGDLQAVRHDFDAKLKDYDGKVSLRISKSQVVNPFDGKKVAKEMEQTFMVKLEKMNNMLVECLRIRMDKFKEHFDDELAALANHCNDMCSGMGIDLLNCPVQQKERSKKQRKKPGRI